MIELYKRIPAQNMARFYRVSLAPTLFGEVSVLRSWGRIGTAGRTRVETFASPRLAEAAARQTRDAKERRGYTSTNPIIVIM